MSSISIETVRKVLGDGDAFVKISLPKLSARDEVLEKRFAAYYDGLLKGFEKYTEKTLTPAAAKRSGAPYGAALNTVLCYENEKLLSLYTDATVSDGRGSRHRRNAVLWHKPTGTVTDPRRLFIKGAKRPLLSLLAQAAEEKSQSSAQPLFSDFDRRLRVGFKWENFYLSPKSAVFFFHGGVLNEKNVPFPLPLTAKALEELLSDEGREWLWGLEKSGDL